MTQDEALETLAEAVTAEAMREVIDNGLVDTYLDAELTDAQYGRVRARLEQRIAAGPDPTAVADAVRALTEP